MMINDLVQCRRAMLGGYKMLGYCVPLGMFFYHLERKELSATAESYQRIIEDRRAQ